jgi:K(+)-stimulated pyrophosphate-energized sodium pump
LTRIHIKFEREENRWRRRSSEWSSHGDILEKKALPDYEKCVDISTKNALKKMIFPTLLTLASPILVGLVLRPHALGDLLWGGTCSAALLASFFTFGGAL